MNDKKLGKLVLNGIWDENIKKVSEALDNGADVNWVINGYPLLVHAVYTRNKDMVVYLISKGAKRIDEALGFALERALGDMVRLLMFEGQVPRYIEVDQHFGPYPRRSVVINQV